MNKFTLHKNNSHPISQKGCSFQCFTSQNPVKQKKNTKYATALKTTKDIMFDLFILVIMKVKVNANIAENQGMVDKSQERV
jgi:hypothetical protein